MGSIGSGLGGQIMVAAQTVYGTWVTPTRALEPKSCKMSYDPHIVQGGPYLAGGRLVDIGSANIATWLDAKGTLVGDMLNSGDALLLANALGSGAIMTQLASTTAFELGGATGAVVGCPDGQNYFSMQLGVPDTGGTLHPENYHGCKITKGEWVFERGGLVTKSYEIDAQYVEKTTALVVAPSYSSGVVPFNMSGANCVFSAGALGAEVAIDGVRKATFTVEHKLDTARAYLGNQYKDEPVTNGIVDILLSLECDYTVAVKTGLFDLFLAHSAVSVIVTSIGNTIGASGHPDTFELNVTNGIVQSGGESPLDGPEIVKNTIALKGTVDTANDPALKAFLISADSAF